MAKDNNPTLRFEPLKGTRPAFQPTEQEGTLMLRYAPPQGTGTRVTKDRPRLLVTGTKLIVPDGYLAAVAQIRPHGTASVYQYPVYYSAGTTAEIEIMCYAGEHDGTGLSIGPGEIIGAAWLVPAHWSKRKEEVKA